MKVASLDTLKVNGVDSLGLGQVERVVGDLVRQVLLNTYILSVL